MLHTLSWQMARHMNVPVAGVYVANPGYTFGTADIPRGAVLTELDGQPLANLADARKLIATLGHRPARHGPLLHAGRDAGAAAQDASASTAHGSR